MTPAVVTLSALAGGAGLAAAGGARLWRYGTREEPCQVEVTRHQVESTELPSELDGLTICQISDLHVSPHRRNERAITRALEQVQADLYVFTGDMIYGPDAIPVFFRWLDSHGDRLRPAVAILGNAEHKSFVRTQDVLDGFAGRGIQVLSNASLRLPVHGGEIQVVGTDDPHTHHCDIQAAYAGADPALWTLLLSHSPDGLAALTTQRADLMLCGHTHGGQVCLPRVGGLWTHTHRVHAFIAGWYNRTAIRRELPHCEGVERLYVCRGLGTGGIPLRLFCRPEIPVFTLERVQPL